MRLTMSRQTLPLLALAFAALLQATPAPLRLWVLKDAVLSTVNLPAGSVLIEPATQADLDADGKPETLSLADGSLTILSGEAPAWQSPAGWQVLQAAFGDLNNDSLPEVALLVWRPFQPWPVDAFLPYSGRIAGFHDQAGNSCHFILIGWINAHFGELWAGSALADPLTAFRAADLDGDADQELITLEGRYTDLGSTPPRALKVWEWNGFGFSVVSSLAGSFSSLALARYEHGPLMILTP
jgi:hypothetical protein